MSAALLINPNAAHHHGMPKGVTMYLWAILDGKVMFNKTHATHGQWFAHLPAYKKIMNTPANKKLWAEVAPDRGYVVVKGKQGYFVYSEGKHLGDSKYWGGVPSKVVNVFNAAHPGITTHNEVRALREAAQTLVSNPYEGDSMNGGMQYYEAVGVSGSCFSNYGAFVSTEQAEQMANTVGVDTILCEPTENDGELYWVIADEKELLEAPEFEAMGEGDLTVEENPSKVSMLSKLLDGTHVMEPANGLKSYHAAREVINASRMRDAYLRNSKVKSLLKNFRVMVSMQGDATRIYRPDTKQELIIGDAQQNPFPFQKCIRAAKRKGVTNVGAYCATVDRRMHPNGIISRASHTISEAYKGVKHAVTKKSQSKKALQRLREAEVPAKTNPLIKFTSHRMRDKGLRLIGNRRHYWSMYADTGYGVYDASLEEILKLKAAKIKFSVVRDTSTFHAGVEGHYKHNPEDSAESLYTEFHGRAPGELLEITESVHEHEHLTGLGDLAQLKVRTLKGKEAIINVVETKSPKDMPDPSQLPKSERIVLACSEDGKQLYFVGGDQSVDVFALGYEDDEVKEHMCLGVLFELMYQTEKGFDKFQLTNYYHELGEETGSQPMLLLDTVSNLLSVAGGAYEVKDIGIVN